MTIAVPIALFGWPFAVVAMFLLLPPRVAAFSATIGAWLFLPTAGYKIEGLPEYSKVSVTAVSILLAAAVADSSRLTSFRLKLLDIPVMLFCVAPLLSSLDNDLGWYDGASATFTQLVTWLVPYLIGRLYLRTADDARFMLLVVFFGGLMYLPLCWTEMRLSPQLHNWIYGFSQHQFLQTIRGDGYRPMVFMQHGLAVALYMAAATIAGFALWQSKLVGRLGPLTLGPLVALMAINIPLLRSGNALVLTAMGGVQLFFAKRFGAVLAFPAFITLVTLPALYVVDRLNSDLVSSTLVSVASAASAERAQSLEFRVQNERALIARAMERPVFGWGGWGRARVYDDLGKDTSVTDSLWIIIFGNTGLVGLIALAGLLMAPLLVFAWRTRGIPWSAPPMLCWLGCAMMVVLYAWDCCFNALSNPIYLLSVGGVVNGAATRGGNLLKAQAKFIVQDSSIKLIR